MWIMDVDFMLHLSNAIPFFYESFIHSLIFSNMTILILEIRALIYLPFYSAGGETNAPVYAMPPPSGGANPNTPFAMPAPPATEKSSLNSGQKTDYTGNLNSPN